MNVKGSGEPVRDGEHDSFGLRHGVCCAAVRCGVHQWRRILTGGEGGGSNLFVFFYIKVHTLELYVSKYDCFEKLPIHSNIMYPLLPRV